MITTDEGYYEYQLRAVIPGSDWITVPRDEWIRAERSAGFRPKLWSGDPNYMKVEATGGFSSSYGISGRLVRTEKPFE